MLGLQFFRTLGANDTANNPLNPGVDNYHYFSHDNGLVPRGRVPTIGSVCSTKNSDRLAFTVTKHVNDNETQGNDAVWQNGRVRSSYHISQWYIQHLHNKYV